MRLKIDCKHGQDDRRLAAAIAATAKHALPTPRPHRTQLRPLTSAGLSHMNEQPSEEGFIPGGALR